MRPLVTIGGGLLPLIFISVIYFCGLICSYDEAVVQQQDKDHLKPVFGVFNQARLKPHCAATEAR